MSVSFAVEVTDLQKHYGNLHVLQGLSLNVERGITYGLLGPNGAGKTTLIRAMMGLTVPDQGQIKLLGVIMPDKNILSQVGYMTQSVALYEELTVFQNVKFFADLAGIARSDKEAIKTLELVNLADRARSRVQELSGGMKQRCSLACALVHHPSLLVLDEPTVGVDPQLRVQFWEHFRQLNQQGITLIVSSHVMDEAERCDRLGFVREGRILAEGTASELRQKASAQTLEEAFLYFADNAIQLGP